MDQIQKGINAFFDSARPLVPAHIGLDIPWMQTVHLNVTGEDLGTLRENLNVRTQCQLGSGIEVVPFLVNVVTQLFRVAFLHRL